MYHYHTKLMMKEARFGGKFQWHQDYGLSMTIMPSIIVASIIFQPKYILTALVSLFATALSLLAASLVLGNPQTLAVNRDGATTIVYVPKTALKNLSSS